MAELNTYGDLKKAIKAISLKQKGEKIGQVAIDTILGAVPGLGVAKTTFDFVRAAFSKPDTKKTNTWLDKLDIDDDMSSIVDDTVENGFLKTIANTIDQESDDKPLEPDFNMNAKMVDYLKTNYEGRTIAGIKENNLTQFGMKERFQQLAGIKEVITATSPTQVQGQIKTDLFKKLNVADFDPTKFLTTINLVKQGKSLNPAANKVLADIMVAMIKTSDDTLLNQIFANLKQIEAK
jgi:hypothetical protein